MKMLVDFSPTDIRRGLPGSLARAIVPPLTPPRPPSGGRKRLKTKFHKLSDYGLPFYREPMNLFPCRENEDYDTLFLFFP